MKDGYGMCHCGGGGSSQRKPQEEEKDVARDLPTPYNKCTYVLDRRKLEVFA